MYVCLSTATIDIVDHDIRFLWDLQQKSNRTGHRTCITSTVEIIDIALIQVPLRTDTHLCLVVTAEDTREMVGISQNNVLTQSRESHSL